MKIMGWLIFLLIVAGIIAIIVAVKKKKKKEAFAELLNSIGLDIADQIKNELVRNGYGFTPPQKKIENLDWDLDYTGGDYGWHASLYFTKGDDKGTLHVCFGYGKNSIAYSIDYSNKRALKGQFYAIQVGFGLIVESRTESKEIPPFIEIAASVIKANEYKLVRPDWWYERCEGADKYLNVMFQ